MSTARHSETATQFLQNTVIIGLRACGWQSGGTHKRWSLQESRDIDDRYVPVDDEGYQQLRLI